MKERLSTVLIRNGVAIDFTYRLRAVFYSAHSLIYTLIFPVVWLAIYGSRTVLFGYTRADLLTYFIGVMFMEHLVETYVDYDMNRQIRDGNISGILLKPVGVIWYFFWNQFGYRIVRLSFYAIVFIPVVFFFNVPFQFPTQLSTVGIFFIALVIGHIITFNIHTILGALAFWFEEAMQISTAYWMLTHMLIGVVAPIVFFPDWLQTVSRMLPFQYVIYTPLAIFLEKLSQPQMMDFLVIGAVWAIATTLLRIHVVKRAIANYNAIGG